MAVGRKPAWKKGQLISNGLEVIWEVAGYVNRKKTTGPVALRVPHNAWEVEVKRYDVVLGKTISKKIFLNGDISQMKIVTKGQLQKILTAKQAVADANRQRKTTDDKAHGRDKIDLERIGETGVAEVVEAEKAQSDKAKKAKAKKETPYWCLVTLWVEVKVDDQRMSDAKAAAVIEDALDTAKVKYDEVAADVGVLESEL